MKVKVFPKVMYAGYLYELTDNSQYPVLVLRSLRDRNLSIKVNANSTFLTSYNEVV
jgi:hypothetical protein